MIVPIDGAVMHSTIDGPKKNSSETGQLKVVRQYFPKYDNRKDMSCYEVKNGGNQ